MLKFGTARRNPIVNQLDRVAHVHDWRYCSANQCLQLRTPSVVADAGRTGRHGRNGGSTIEPLMLNKVVKLIVGKVGKSLTVVCYQQRFGSSSFGKDHLVRLELDMKVLDVFNTIGHRLHY